VLIKADKNKARQKRHLRVRNHVSGTAERPRLNVYRSLANIYAQVNLFRLRSLSEMQEPHQNTQRLKQDA